MNLIRVRLMTLRYVFFISLILMMGSAVAQKTKVTKNNISAVAWSSHHSLLAVGGSIEGDLGIWIFNTEATIVANIEVAGGIPSLAWSPDETKLAALVTGSPDTISIWDIQHNSLLFTLPQESATSTYDIHWSPDGKYLATSRGDIDLWNIEEGILAVSLDHPGRPSVVAFAWHPNAELLFTLTEQNVLRVWDVKAARIQREFQLPQGTNVQPISFVSMDVNSDGTQLALGDSQGNLQILDTISGMILNPLSILIPNNLGRAVWFVDWQPNGNLIAASGDRGPITIWDMSNGQLIDTLERNTSGLLQEIRFSSYGGRLALANDLAAITPESQVNTVNSIPQIFDGAVQIFVPAPTLDRLNAITELCVRDASTQSRAVTGLASQRVTSLDALPDFVAQVESLPEGAIPAACRADLLAVADALLKKGGN